MTKKLFTSLLLIMSIHIATAQPSQTIKGIVTNKVTSLPMQFAEVSILNTQPLIGSVTDSLGAFTLQNVPIQRFSLLE